MNEPAAGDPATQGDRPSAGGGDDPATVEHPIARVLPLLSPAHLDRDFDYLVPPALDARTRTPGWARASSAGGTR